jgi:hypothetical protein
MSNRKKNANQHLEVTQNESAKSKLVSKNVLQFRNSVLTYDE